MADPTNPYAGQTPLALGPTGQPTADYQNPATSSPLLALMQYLNPIQDVTDSQSNTDNGSMSTNPNLQETMGSGGVSGIQSELALAQKYDPNAKIQYNPGGQGDNDNSTPTEQIVMDFSKLPKIPTGYTAIGGVSDSTDQNPHEVGEHVLNGTDIYNDPNWGAVAPTSDINQNYDTHGGGFFKSNIGNWAPMLTLGMAGIGGLGFLGGAAGTAGSTSGLGSLGNLALGSLDTGKLPGMGSLASILGSLSGIPGGSTLANLAYGATQGAKLNPTSAAISNAPALIKYLSTLGGGNGG